MYSGMFNRSLGEMVNQIFGRLTQLSSGSLSGKGWYEITASTAHSLAIAESARCQVIFQQMVGWMIFEDRRYKDIKRALTARGVPVDCLDVVRGVGTLVANGSFDDVRLQQGASWAEKLARCSGHESFDVIGWLLFKKDLDVNSLSAYYLLKFAHALAMVPLVRGEECVRYLADAVDAYVIARAVLRSGNLFSDMCYEYVSLIIQLQKISSSSPS